MLRGKFTGIIAALVGVLLLAGAQAPANAAGVPLSPYSWDPGLYATASSSGTEAHAWGQRQTGGAWGTGSVNYQSGATSTNRLGSSGNLSVVLKGTYCPGGTCSYGAGSGYKGLVQFWNDPNNFIAFGLINDPGVSPSGTTIMIEGSANGRPVGGYWPAGAVSGTSHQFAFAWSSAGISVVIDNQVTLGPYPVSATNPSVSFLAAARNTGDISDTTFAGISFSDGTPTPVTIPAGNPYLTYSATMKESGSGTGHSAYINAHDNNNNAISVGIQRDSAAPESGGQPYYVWELVQGGNFTYSYVTPAVENKDVLITLKWWSSGTAVFYADNKAIATIPMTLNPRLFFNVEGNARLNGDSVSDTFTNVQVAVGDNCPTYCGLNGVWNTTDFNFYGLHASRTNGNTQNGANFTVSGTVSGLPGGKDWDSELVAGIGMIAQYWAGQ